MRSESGPMFGEPFTGFLTTRATLFDSQSFRLMLLRRLRFFPPFIARLCQCGRPLDLCGHHRAACARVGVPGRRGFALETAAAFGLSQGAQLAIDSVRSSCRRRLVQRRMEALTLMHVNGRRSRVRNSSVEPVVPDLSFSRLRWPDGGLPRRRSSSGHLWHRKQHPILSSCQLSWCMHGVTGGEGC